MNFIQFLCKGIELGRMVQMLASNSMVTRQQGISHNPLNLVHVFVLLGLGMSEIKPQTGVNNTQACLKTTQTILVDEFTDYNYNQNKRTLS